MKKILTNIILIFIIPISGFGQSYIESEKFELSKFEYSDFMKILSENEKFDGYISIFIKNKKGDNLKEIMVYAESYENDATVQELENIQFTNVQKIIKVQISECACYCDTTIYYWLITNQNDWIPLPIVVQESYEFEMKSKEYVFSKNGINTIELKEYQDERIDKNIYTLENIKRKSERVLNTLIWDGKSLK